MPETLPSVVRGPYFDELFVGQAFTAPNVTLTQSLATARQAIVGERLAIFLDRELAAEVVHGTPASPGLVWDLAIGQSTQATRNVIANLFYRGLVFRRAPELGDTLSTVTTVAALKENSRKPGRTPSGLAVLRVHTVDQQQRTVLDFERCAMIPVSDGAPPTGHKDVLGDQGDDVDTVALASAVVSWNLAAFSRRVPGSQSVAPGTAADIAGYDVVTSAPELARLTMNIARVHHEGRPRGHRLVYGGHTVAVALNQVLLAFPQLVTVVGWHSCRHVAPVREGDLLTTRVEVEKVAPRDGGGSFLHLRARVDSLTEEGNKQLVLDWRFVAVAA